MNAGPAVRLVRLPTKAMVALEAGDRTSASREAGVELSDFLAGEECAWLWRIRLKQIAEDPDSAEWVARAGLTVPDGVAVGHAGFHGPPDETGMVEVGYTVDPKHRRRGYARAMLRELIAWAGRDPRVTTVRAAISPDNVASLGTIRGFGFAQVGEQWDEEDGLEIIHELALRA
ncbi:MAG: GNAT family N-acetyltransferase [Pseudonocardia sp.]